MRKSPQYYDKDVTIEEESDEQEITPMKQCNDTTMEEGTVEQRKEELPTYRNASRVLSTTSYCIIH